MKGKGIFDRFGFNLLKQELMSEVGGQKLLMIYREWNFDGVSFDWLNQVDKSKLSDLSLFDV